MSWEGSEPRKRAGAVHFKPTNCESKFRFFKKKKKKDFMILDVSLKIHIFVESK